ncbi:hypothetical protein QBC46DRAFT_365017 [Diplogelasinospora grovesii]|uniref:Uncharacterized protein n=1 Tax=Diplogelasinospora grovesii TaxID=303347 RepID=A0AAN6N659_9PEZI|nr:hypothetical protein QBC46DRAFT_365017 [Diplogelasinospora grovesii]
MTNLSAIREENAVFKSEQHRSAVCVFTMVTLFPDPTGYVLGRSEAKFAAQRAKPESLKPNAKIVFFQGDACDSIAAAESKVDYLFMSAGLIPLNGPQQGLGICFSLPYHARIRLIQKLKLLPLLRKSPDPRVLSVLNAGNETPLREDDMGLDKNWALRAAMNHTTAMMSCLPLAYLAQAHEDVTFLYAFPGLLEALTESSWLWKLVVMSIKNVVGMLMWLRGISPEESGERQSWHRTVGEFEKGKLRQSGEYSDEIPASNMNVFENYNERGWPENVWAYTTRVFKAATAGSVSSG